jgi:uncharacterized FlaG/YvyC family protein
MSENQLTNVKGVDFNPAARYHPVELARAAQPDPKAAAHQPENEPAAGQEMSGLSARSERAPHPLSSVHLQFKVDTKTQDVTVLVLDKATQKVLRTIPPEEMSKLQAGDLLELFT